MSAATLFESMKSIIEKPGFPFLKFYKQDFYEYDKAHLEREDAPGSTYLWLVRESGTHLSKLRQAPRVNAEVDYLIGSRAHDTFFVYLLDTDSGTVKKIDCAKAKSLLSVYDYAVSDGLILFRGDPVASISVSMTPWGHAEMPKGIVTIISDKRHFSLGTLKSLRTLAVCEVINKTSSLFTKTESVILNGHDLLELIDDMSAPEAAVRKARSEAVPQGCLS